MALFFVAVGVVLFLVTVLSVSISGVNTIRVRCQADIYDEGIASGSILPGMNVVLQSAAEASGRHTYAPGATLAGGTASTAAAGPMRIAIEDGLQGKTVNDAYASGDNVRFIEPRRGDTVQVLVAS